MKKEIWRDIPGYEGLYQVSNHGRVKSLSHQVRCQHWNRVISERILKTNYDKRGYAYVMVHKNLRTYCLKIHRAVALAFLPNPHNYREVNHKDENPSNSRLDNLEWCDHLYNCRYGTRPKRMSIIQLNRPDRSREVEQLDLNLNHIAFYPSLMEAERKTGVYARSICYACKGILKTTGGFKWRYK